MEIVRGDLNIRNMFESGTLNKLTLGADVAFNGHKTTILRWMYHHSHIKVDVQDFDHFKVYIAAEASTFAAEYGKALGSGIAGEVPGTIGVIWSLGDAVMGTGVGGAVQPSGKPGKARHVVDLATGSRYWVRLQAGGTLHPNPHAVNVLMSKGASMIDVAARIEKLSW